MVSKAAVALKKTDSIGDEVQQLHEAVSRRAYELFHEGGAGSGAIGDWLTAERELVRRPAVELRQKENQFEVLVALAGVEPKDLDVQVTPEGLLIKAEASHEHTVDEGTVHLCEFNHGRVWRSLHFPQTIDPTSARVEYQNGLLRLTATIAKPQRKKIVVQTP